MRKINLGIFVLFLAASVSCGPSAFLLNVETRHPSVAGVNLLGKSVSVIYSDNGGAMDSLFSANMASAFVEKLEDEYFAGDSVIPLYCLDNEDNIEYSTKENMVSLLTDSGADVLFLFDSPVFPGLRPGELQPYSGTDFDVPFAIKLYVYDSMDKRDTVLQFSGRSSAKLSEIADAASVVGKASGTRFTPVWKAEEILFFIYDSQIWYDTYEYVNSYQWQKAMDIWISMLDTGNIEKKACLEYNLAAACYIQGQYELASDWVKLSLEHEPMSVAKSLQSKIDSRK